MKKYNYIKLSKTKKLRYMGNYFKKKLYIVFLPGFMSDIEGEKPKAFKRYAVKKKIRFLTLDYSGHGKSSGKFIKGNISQWSNDTKILIRKFVKKNNFIIIGSSMGSWIALNQFKYFKNQIKGFYWDWLSSRIFRKINVEKISKKKKNEIKIKGISYIKNGDYEYPITYQLIKDGRKNKVLTKKINSKILITMFHGQKDEAVPVSFSRKVLSIFSNAKKKLLLSKMEIIVYQTN